MINRLARKSVLFSVRKVTVARSVNSGSAATMRPGKEQRREDNAICRRPPDLS